MNQIKIKLNLHFEEKSDTKYFYYNESDIDIEQNMNEISIKRMIKSCGLCLKNMNDEIEITSDIEKVEVSLVNRDSGPETLIKIIALMESKSFPISRFYEIEHKKEGNLSEKEETHYYEKVIFVN